MGLLLMEHLLPVLAEIDTAETEVKNRLRHGLSTLRVGTFPTAGARLLPQALSKVIPGSGVHVELLEAEPLVLIEKLRARALHCALIYDLGEGAASDRPDLTVTQLGEDPYWLVMSSRHPLAGTDVIDLCDLRDEGWILARDSYDPGDRGLIAACEVLGFRPRVALRSDDYGLIQGFVAAGIGVAFVPEMAVDLREEIVVRPTVQVVGARSIQFVTLASERPPVVTALGTALRRSAQSL